jgi:hypothetical protein
MKGGARPGMTAKLGSRSRRSRPQAPTAHSYDTRTGLMKTAQLFHVIDEAASSATEPGAGSPEFRSPQESDRRCGSLPGGGVIARETGESGRAMVTSGAACKRSVDWKRYGSERRSAGGTAPHQVRRRCTRGRSSARFIEAARLRLLSRDCRCIWYRVRIHTVSNASLPHRGFPWHSRMTTVIAGTKATRR